MFFKTSFLKARLIYDWTYHSGCKENDWVRLVLGLPASNIWSYYNQGLQKVIKKQTWEKWRSLWKLLYYLFTTKRLGNDHWPLSNREWNSSFTSEWAPGCNWWHLLKWLRSLGLSDWIKRKWRMQMAVIKQENAFLPGDRYNWSFYKEVLY